MCIGGGKDVEDEQHFMCSDPAYSDGRQKYASPFQQAISDPDLFTKPNAVWWYSQRVFFM